MVNTMASKITPYLIHLTYDAALKSFWRKISLKKFLRECNVSDNFLSTWIEGETKREFLDRLFEKLQLSDNGKKVIFKMANFLSEQATFPDLENWEDSRQKISDARKAVNDLNSLLRKQDDEIKTEKEIEERKKFAREESKKLQKATTDKQRLSDRLNALYSLIGTQKGGYEFQDWFYDLLDFCEIINRRPYMIDGRQIDGSLTHEGTTYLIELKFTKQQSEATDIDSIKAKIENKADNTMGIMVSISGYSSVAKNEASGKKAILLLLDYSHLYMFLTGIMNFGDIIARIRRHASQTGETYLEVSKFGG